MISSTITSPNMKAWLVDWLANELAVVSTTIDTARTFLDFGLNSVQAMTMVGDIETKLGFRLSPTLAWDYPSIDSLADYLDQRISQEQDTKPALIPTPVTQGAASDRNVEELLAELDMLSDQDVDSLLDQYLSESK